MILIISSCSLFSGRKNQVENREVVRKVRQSEIKRILDNQELKVVVDYNSTNYFIFKGQPMGFQYELLKAFANDMGVSLHVVVNNNMDETFEGLNKSKYDLIAKNLIVDEEQARKVDFSEPYSHTRQVLVQRKKSSPIKPNLQGAYVNDPFDLANKTVHVQRGTAHVHRLISLEEEISANIDVVEDSVNNVEQLIAQVANGEIDYTVCDELVAKVNQRFYPWIDVSVPLSFNQQLSWAVRKNSVEWKKYIDKWMVDYRETSEYKELYNKYFVDISAIHDIQNKYHSKTKGKISQFDGLIRELSASYGFDWRLIAAIIMQESGFEKEAQSWAGALGLMQLMPKTAEKFGVGNAADPKQNIRGGLEYLLSLQGIFENMIPDGQERIKFILAAYNVGVGHVLDARALARKYRKDPQVWKGNVEPFMLKKSSPMYYLDSEVKSGYCNGTEACNYVRNVLELYQHYLNLLPADEPVFLATTPTQQ